MVTSTATGINKMETIDKVWGSEEIICNGEYCGKRMTLKKGFRCSLHHHKIKHETFYVESGTMLIQAGDDKEPWVLNVLTAGGAAVIKPGDIHSFYGIEDVVFFEFSTHDDASDSYRMDTSGEGMTKEMQGFKYERGRKMN